ncbi:MAG: ABC transporter permease [Thermodesulfobacteriota bacterium]
MSNAPLTSIAAIAWKGVSRKLFRNIVLVLAVALLVALLVFALLFNRAVTEDIEAAARKLGADIVLVPSEAKGNAEEFILESKIKSFYMDRFVFDSISDLPEIKQATYHVYLNTLSSGCCSIDEGQVIAFDQEHDFVIAPWLEVGPPRLASGEVYVGSYVYDYLGLINTASLFGKGVKVVGHLQPTNTGLDHGVFMRLDDLDKISESAMGTYKHGDISIIFIRLKEGVDAEKAVATIRKINPAIGIMTRGDIGAGVRNTLKDITRVFSITILISATLAVLLAWSTFTAMTNERRREVGILRAIGARQSHIMRIFLLEATIISTIGGLLGIGVGHALIRYLAGDFNLLTKLGAVSALNLTTLLLSLAALLAGIAVCLIGAAMPTIRLARLEPLQAIKEE